MRSGPRDNGELLDVSYVIELIDLLEKSPRNFWGGKGYALPEKDLEDPVGIIGLKNILATFQQQYKDLRNNEAALLQFFNICRDAVGKEVIKIDKKNPNACELYQALMDYDKEKIHDLHRARVKIREFKSVEFRLSDYDQHPTIKKHENGLAKIEAIRDEGRPDLLLMQDYLVSLSKKHSKYIGWGGVYPALSKYVDDVLLREESEFLKVIPTPIDLALCIRTDMYCPRIHEKDGWRECLVSFDERDIFGREQRRSIEDTTHKIMREAFSKHFNVYFKGLKDVEDFMNNLEMNRNFTEGPLFDFYERRGVSNAFVNAIIKHPNILNSIAAADQQTRKNLYGKLPGLEAAIKKQVYTNSALGLLFAKKHGALGLMDKNIIKKIAGHSADQIDEEPKKFKK